MKILDGATAGGTRVVVEHDPGPNYGTYTVEIDGEPVEVLWVSRLRDGGTTILALGSPGGRKLVFPNALGNPDRTPRLDGERVEE